MKDTDDSKLVIMAQQGDLDAEEALMRKYKEVARIKARYYYMAGADEDDVIQEGMIGLLKAIRQYDPAREASFATFAGICITRQIIDAIRTADREKHRALNTSISLNKPIGDEEDGLALQDTLMAAGGESPEALLVVRDMAACIMHNRDNVFSKFEMQVLNALVQENDYEQIARMLGRSTKSIDNAIQRITRKIVRLLQFD